MTNLQFVISFILTKDVLNNFQSQIVTISVTKMHIFFNFKH